MRKMEGTVTSTSQLIDSIGVPGGIRTLVCAVKALCPGVSY